MLVLTRKPGQSLTIGVPAGEEPPVEVVVVSVDHATGEVALGVTGAEAVATEPRIVIATEPRMAT